MNGFRTEAWGVGGHLNWQIIFMMISPRTRLVSGTSAVGISACYWCLLLLPADEYGTDRQQIRQLTRTVQRVLVNQVRNIVLL